VIRWDRIEHMRMLLPTFRADLDDDALDAAYAWPDEAHWLRANMVSTVDGAARSPEGLSHGISSDADRAVFGRLRALADVVLAGAATVREEGYRPAKVKPRYTDQRRVAHQTPVPAIALVSCSLAVDLSSPLFTEATVPTIVITCAASDKATRDRVAETAEVLIHGDDDVDLVAAVTALQERGLGRVHCEGGPHLLAQLTAAGLLDELLLSVSPVLAGGGYDAHNDISRILTGAVLPAGLHPLRLDQLLEEDGSLFLRYRL
jgi:riboflavin biosynthesis pyrimidine reductase